MAKKTISSVNVAGKRVLIRVDFNVPIEGGGNGDDGPVISDDRRVREALPTIRSVLSRGGSAVLMSHLGRPEGNGYQAEHSLAPVATRLAELLGAPVSFPSHDCVDPAAAEAVRGLSPGGVVLLENLRFKKGEKKGDPALAAGLAAYGEVYVNDAFGTAHRDDASMVAVPTAMTGKPRVAGLLLEKELRYLGGALSHPRRPFVVVLGGAKIADKLPVIDHLLPRTDAVLVGGAMAYTFLKARGVKVGASRVEEDRLADAERIMKAAAQSGCRLLIPTDHVCSTLFAETGGQQKTCEGDIPDGFMGLDIGPATRAAYTAELARAGTIVWNGPMGVFEWPRYAAGSRAVAEAIVAATARGEAGNEARGAAGAVSIVGGGDSAAAAEQFGLAEGFSHVSTGGGASLEMLSGKPFNSVELLDEA